jgi:hypothetical protein
LNTITNFRRKDDMLNHFWIAVGILMAGVGFITWSVTLGSTLTSQGGVWTEPVVKSVGVVGLLASMVLFVLVTRHDRGKKTLR